MTTPGFSSRASDGAKDSQGSAAVTAGKSQGSRGNLRAFLDRLEAAGITVTADRRTLLEEAAGISKYRERLGRQLRCPSGDYGWSRTWIRAASTTYPWQRSAVPTRWAGALITHPRGDAIRTALVALTASDR